MQIQIKSFVTIDLILIAYMPKKIYTTQMYRYANIVSNI